MRPRTVPDVLDAAAAIIRRNGWHQGGFYRPPSRGHAETCAVCAMGAINIAVFGKPVASDLPHSPEQNRLSLDSYLCVERFLDTDRGLGGWNDQSERTVEEVLAALEGAAQAWRERGGAS